MSFMERIRGRRQEIFDEAEKTTPPPVYASPGRRIALREATVFTAKLIQLIEPHAGPSSHTGFYAGPRGGSGAEPQSDRHATLTHALALLTGSRAELEAEHAATVEHPVPPAGRNAQARYEGLLRHEIKHQTVERYAAVGQFIKRGEWEQVLRWALDAARLPTQIERDLNSRR